MNRFGLFHFLYVNGSDLYHFFSIDDITSISTDISDIDVIPISSY